MLITDIKFQDPEIQFSLPGAGDKHEDCGQFYTLGHFPSPGVVHWHKRVHSCHRRECPICWTDWQKRGAAAIRDRIAIYELQTHRRPVHYVLSPPQDIDISTIGKYRLARKSAYKIGKKRGIRGGVMIFHTRDSRRDDHEYLKAHCSEGPHWHIIGDGWLDFKNEDFKKDGWIVKNLRLRASGKSVYGTAMYILDHAAIPGYPALSQSTSDQLPRLDTITWFGTMSYNKLKIPKLPMSESILCPECLIDIPRIDWYILSWCNGEDPPELDHGSSELAPNTIRVVRPLSSWSDY
jgi:hypothetical protein